MTGPGIESSLVFNWPLNAGVANGTLRLPAGSDRYISGVAFDQAGSPTDAAGAILTIVEGDNSSTVLASVLPAP